MKTAKEALLHGDEFPFDAHDSWWYNGDEDKGPPPAPFDWAHRAARGIIAELKERRGIKGGFTDLEEKVRVELVQKIARIIGAAFAEADII